MSLAFIIGWAIACAIITIANGRLAYMHGYRMGKIDGASRRNHELDQWAKDHPAPQSWYDEDYGAQL